MKIYIPQNIDPYNTHLKNLMSSYSSKGIEVIVGYNTFIKCDVIPDIIHFHFLEGVLKFINYDDKLFFERLEYFKNNGVRFLYTVHDAKPHAEIKKLNFHHLFSKYIDYINLFIHHGELSINILKKAYPGISSKSHIICHHGDYMNDMGGFNDNKEQARLKLKLPLNKKILLIFGQLQFKNTSFAEDVLKEVRLNHPDAVLLMAGVLPKFKYNRLNLLYYKFNNAFLNKFRNNKILIHKRFTQHETYLLFISADVIFLPHKSGLTTGIIPMAATLGKPFVYPNIGVFDEQAHFCYAQKYECGNVSAASDAIDKILVSDVINFDNAKWLENNNWDRHVEQILENL